MGNVIVNDKQQDKTVLLVSLIWRVCTSFSEAKKRQELDTSYVIILCAAHNDG